jgi:hypothetical protein
MTEPETVALLTHLLTERLPFVHVRFGDGDVFFATGTGPKLTADGEEWTPELGDRLRQGWRTLARVPNLIVGDVDSYAVSDGCEPQWRELLAEAEAIRGERLERVHIEALRCGFGHALPFYEALAHDTRAKVYVCSNDLRGAAEMLGAFPVIVPLKIAWKCADAVVDLIGEHDFEIVIFSAGRGGKLMQAALATDRPELTQIDIGSGLDLVFGGVRRGTDAGVDVKAIRREYQGAGLKL